MVARILRLLLLMTKTTVDIGRMGKMTFRLQGVATTLICNYYAIFFFFFEV